jgi:hypothetical protein
MQKEYFIFNSIVALRATKEKKAKERGSQRSSFHKKE